MSGSIEHKSTILRGLFYSCSLLLFLGLLGTGGRARASQCWNVRRHFKKLLSPQFTRFHSRVLFTVPLQQQKRQQKYYGNVKAVGKTMWNFANFLMAAFEKGLHGQSHHFLLSRSLFYPRQSNLQNWSGRVFATWYITKTNFHSK